MSFTNLLANPRVDMGGMGVVDNTVEEKKAQSTILHPSTLSVQAVIHPE